ncbi:diguanylate cyclase domain-containing protein [Paramicrobacterium fandaimingii]|uniref:diguanylate cyclase domain-containing protein n=1 Tax=Paramicrobacterium fandaimingii TaxID=2708079 RepID=UPI0014224632|nr:diguanylate cyclase [Microbacterium fandaimingii]
MIDATTVLIMSGLLTVVCAVIFVLNSAFGRQDAVGLFWSAGLLFAIGSSMSFAVFGLDPSMGWANAAGNAMLAIGMGCVWLGIRSFNGRRLRMWIVFGAGAIIFVASLLDSPFGNEWAGAPVSWLGIIAFTAMAAVECFSRRLSGRLNGRILAVVVGTEAVFYSGRFIVFLTSGAQSSAFQVWFGTATTTGLAILLVVAGTLAISILRIERTNTYIESGLYAEPGFSHVGVLDWPHFTTGGADRVSRAKNHGMSSGVVIVTIDSLGDINTAFGKDVGDRAVQILADVLRDTMPPTAIIGRESAGTFGVVTTMADPAEAEDTIARLHNALVESAFDSRANLRLTVSVGVATGATTEAGWQKLFDLATQRRDEAEARGGNLVLDGRE